MAFDAATGRVSGTPTATLTATTFTVTVTDAAGATSAKTFGFTVNPALVTVQAVPSRTVTASGGSTPYSYALSGGTLPSGVTFNQTTGQISGTPVAILATTVFTVTVTDAAAATSAKTFTFTVNSALATVVAAPAVAVTVGRALAPITPVSVAGGTTPYAFALSGGTLPSGLTFSAVTGQLTGTPTGTRASATFTVTVTDAAGATSVKTFCFASFAAGVLFRDDFATIGSRLDLCWWTTEFGDPSFFGRTQLADWVTPGGIGQFVVGSAGAELALNTFNPTGPGLSLYGTHGKTGRTFQPVGAETITYTARVRLQTVQPGLVFGNYLLGCPPGPCTTDHDEIDIELVTNQLQSGSPYQVQLNRYRAEPFGAGHGGFVPLPVGFDPLATHDWTIRWSLSTIEYLVDGVLLKSETTFVPQRPMHVDLNVWGPDIEWPAAYSALLPIAGTAGANQRFVGTVRNVEVRITRPVDATIRDGATARRSTQSRAFERNSSQ